MHYSNEYIQINFLRFFEELKMILWITTKKSPRVFEEQFVTTFSPPPFLILSPLPKLGT